ncbi:SPOR domain-containing protein [Sinimarinibacterium thermocellulolyticum]|uniref:SPOR domain-containing protein n=1 Tax=Sinimarinibacterium thermocellulolyticum TaxID=3170016 RepID=A0ABV2A9F9_9GAMM
MSRDYAQRSRSSGRQARARGAAVRAGLPGWIWLVVGLSVGLVVAAFVYISRPVEHKTLVRTEPAATPAKPDQNAPIPLPPKEKPRFTFYEILKNQEVVVPKDAARDANAPAAGAAPTGGERYVIQVASFRAQADAERQKASLALIGIESRIESVTIDGKDTYYRVRIGPENDWRKVQSTLARLDENGIEALLIKLQ